MYQVTSGLVTGEHIGGSSSDGTNHWPGGGGVEVNQKNFTRGEETEEVGKEDWGGGSIKLGLDELRGRDGGLILSQQGVDDKGQNGVDIDVPLLLQGGC